MSDLVDYMRRYLGDTEITPAESVSAPEPETLPNELVDYIRRYLGDPVA